MSFSHANEIWDDYPELVPGVLLVDGITSDAKVDEAIARYNAIAENRLSATSEGEAAGSAGLAADFFQNGAEAYAISLRLRKRFCGGSKKKSRCHGCIRWLISATRFRWLSARRLRFSIFQKSPALCKSVTPMGTKAIWLSGRDRKA